LIAARPSGAATRPLELAAGQLAEQARELALVRRQHHGPIGSRPDCLEQCFRVVLEHAHAVGVDDDRGDKLERGKHMLARLGRDPGRRADDQRVDLAREDVAKLGERGERLEHDGRDMRGVNHQGVAFADKCNSPRPRPQRCRRTQPRRARLQGATGHDDTMAAGVFVRLARDVRHRPQMRAILMRR